MTDTLRAREADKYRRMWAVPGYRTRSPGERLLADFEAAIGGFQSRRIIDFGCGTGRPALAMQARGAVVTGVDLVQEALDPGPRASINFLEACLWDLPPNLECDYGYCTDVLEHIPEERVDDVIAAIASASLYGAFFQIASFKDSFGARIGETLHETIQPASWWRERLEKEFADVRISGTDRRIIALCLHV